MTEPSKTTVGICDTQPVTSEGLRTLISNGADLECLWAVNSLAAAVELARHRPPSILMIDKAFGAQQVLEWMAQLRGSASPTTFLVWGSPMTEAEALRFLQAGAKGITSKTADLNTLLACLRAVASGSYWMEDAVFRGAQRADRSSRSDLTPREQQVMAQVEQGLKNKEIARELGIRPGTVKIHLKHIFEKTGVRGRYGLALTGLKEKGLLTLPRM